MCSGDNLYANTPSENNVGLYYTIFNTIQYVMACHTTNNNSSKKDQAYKYYMYLVSIAKACFN